MDLGNCSHQPDPDACIAPTVKAMVNGCVGSIALGQPHCSAPVLGTEQAAFMIVIQRLAAAAAASAALARSAFTRIRQIPLVELNNSPLISDRVD